MAGQPQLTIPVPPTMSIGIDCYELRVEQPSGVDSNLIIDSGKPWSVKLCFRTGGFGATGFQLLGGNGTVDFYYEAMGADKEGALVVPPVPVASTAGIAAPGSVFEYEVVGKPTVTLTQGLYKLTATVRFPTWNFYGFVEGPMIQVP